MQVLLLILSLYTACFAFSSEYKFEISHTSQKKIYELITTIADTPAPLLICNLSRINQLKNDLQQLEPLQFLAYIFNSPYLTYEMEKIKGCSSKYAPFIAGSKAGLCKLLLQEDFEEKISAFASFIRADLNKTQESLALSASMCKKEDSSECFRPFFDFLIDTGSQKQRLVK